jgi:hypothetical protein
VFQHRIVLTAEAKVRDVTRTQVIDAVLQSVEVPAAAGV